MILVISLVKKKYLKSVKNSLYTPYYGSIRVVHLLWSRDGLKGSILTACKDGNMLFVG